MAVQAKDEGKDIVFYSKGTIVGEAFVVDECIGIGDKSTLYRCHVRENAEHLIALKVLHRSAAQSEDVVARFRKEIRASKEIAHPNVIQCLDYFSNDDGISYVMEYAGGGNLKRFIERFHPIQLERIYQFAYELSAGLEAIHGIGIVHRDLKPANVLLSLDQQVKIGDFGLAHVSAGRALTNHGDVIGEIDYVSPEYLESGEFDARSDLYALGLIMFELITGKYPFERCDTVVESIMKRITAPAKAPSELRHGVPTGLDNLVLKLLQRDPNDRFQSAAEVKLALVDLTDSLGLARPRVNSVPVEEPLLDIVRAAESAQSEADIIELRVQVPEHGEQQGAHVEESDSETFPHLRTPWSLRHGVKMNLVRCLVTGILGLAVVWLGLFELHLNGTLDQWLNQYQLDRSIQILPVASPISKSEPLGKDVEHKSLTEVVTSDSHVVSHAVEEVAEKATVMDNPNAELPVIPVLSKELSKIKTKSEEQLRGASEVSQQIVETTTASDNSLQPESVPDNIAAAQAALSPKEEERLALSALDALLRGDKQRTELKSGAGESMQLEHQASELSRYRIKRGDTLSELSKKFHVSTETIATANEVVNPDVIIEGEEFVIPAEGL